MNFKDVEKRMYEDEEFLKYLPLLKEEYWKKATPVKKMQFFVELQRIINEVEPAMPSEVVYCEFTPGEQQNVIVTESCILINEELLKKRYNPYDIFTNYIFEIDIVNNFAMIEDEEFLKTEEGRRIEINSQESILKDWDNYLPRNSEDFFYQPVTWKSQKNANDMVYNLLKYMHKNYGMDSYIGTKVTGLMLSIFDSNGSKNKLEEVFKKMEGNSEKYVVEKEKIESMFDYLRSVDFFTMPDNEFFSLFNDKLMNIYDDQMVAYLFGVFIERELSDCKNLDDIIGELTVGEHEEYGCFIAIDGVYIFVNDYNQAFHNLVVYVSNVKLKEGLCKEIEDKKFLEDAKLCYGYIKELQDEEGLLELPYIENALSYYDYRNIMIDYYYKKIENAIKDSRFYNKGKPSVCKGDFSKYEAFLDFAFGKTFEEVKKEQFTTLKERYAKKIGGKMQ